jgi:hypothetical protein
MNVGRCWLEPFTWEFVTAQNEVLCRQKSAHHGPTSDGHEQARTFWETERRRAMGLYEAVEVCRKCHRLAPFTNFNGNTFAAIARIVVKHGGFAAEDETLARSLAGHIVAGVAGEEEINAFRKLCASLD